VVSGTIELPRITGAVAARDGALLFVSSEPNSAAQVQGAGALLASGRVARADLQVLGVSGLALHDLQDVTWDGVGDAFAVTSHARTPGGDSPEERYRLARLHFDATGKLIEAQQSDALLQAVVNQVPFLADSIRRTPARAGLNIEGLAWDPAGELLVGLRSPTVTESTPRQHGGQEDAVVVRVKNPGALFGSAKEAAVLGDTVKLDLRGQGIRGMAYDPSRKAFWLLSGLSVLPGHPVTAPWYLWLWDGQAAPRRARLPEGLPLTAPTAVCRLEIDGAPRLLIVEGGSPTSRYALIAPPDQEP
jgi:hypothetical protein